MELITGVGPKCFVLAHLANEIAPCKLIQDSLAILDSTLWIQDSTTTTMCLFVIIKFAILYVLQIAIMLI